MFDPDAPCFPRPSPTQKGCCAAGFECAADAGSPSGRRCKPLPAQRQQFVVASAAALAAGGGGCGARVEAGGVCGGAAGPDAGACCPDGFSCQPDLTSIPAGGDGGGSSSGGMGGIGAVAISLSAAYPIAPVMRAGNASLDADQQQQQQQQQQAPQRYTCQAAASFQPLAALRAAAARVPDPVPPLPAAACSCRVDSSGQRVARACPSPWDHPAGASRVPPALAVSAAGALVNAATGAPAALRGVNVFGWEVGQQNIDGLWAFCDDNGGGCKQDGEVPRWQSQAAIGSAAHSSLQLYFWKRRLTNDFATVVWRMKLLGFNAVRLPFTFAALAEDVGGTSSFTACAVSGGRLACADEVEARGQQGRGGTA